MAGNIVFVKGDYWDVHDNAVVNCGRVNGEDGTHKGYEAHGGDGERMAEVAEPQPSRNPYQAELTSEQLRVRHAVEVLREEGVLCYGYDLAWVMLVLNQTDGWPSFDTAVSFLRYLRGTGLKDLPNEDSITRKVSRTRHAHPLWTFLDTSDATETLRRNNVASRFLHCLRTGK